MIHSRLAIFAVHIVPAMACVLAGGACLADGVVRPPIVAGFERFGRSAADDDDRVEAGLLLISELGCTNSHAAAPEAVHVPSKRDRCSTRLASGSIRIGS
jgi:hypothetical protein